jgi:hypothetical protein
MKRMPLHPIIRISAEHDLSPDSEQALARLRCAHCQSLINCDELAQAVLAELKRDYHFAYRHGDKNSALTDSELIEALREGIDRFLRS